MQRLLLLTLVCLALAVKSVPTYAGDFVEDSPSGSSQSGSVDSDSTFDPFSDYSEFEEGSEEEADVNFFHNGRFFSFGFVGGYEAFTDTLGAFYKPSFNYGLFLSYFFDLRFALEVAYEASSHGVDIKTGGSEFTGTVGLQHFDFDFKYYLNTQNVTRGLAALNPYVLLGFSTWYRNTAFDGAATVVRDGAFGMQAGGGIEIPIMHNKAYIGLEAAYHYVAFPDEGANIVVNGVAQPIRPNGDALMAQVMLGMNF